MPGFFSEHSILLRILISLRDHFIIINLCLR